MLLTFLIVVFIYREDVHIFGTGFFLLFIFPAACVYLDSSQLKALAPSRRLRILCAGIWHNIFLAFLATLALLCLPWGLYPFFDTGNGVYVLSISPVSF